MTELINQLNGYIWSYALIGLCLGAGIYFSLGSRFAQLRHIGQMARLIFGNGRKETARGISSFQALAVSVSGRVGTGNIAGVATAIGAGGPGALFWMWMIGLVGAATSYVECSLGQLYKQEDEEGQFRGGPAYYMENGLGWRWYGTIYAAVTLFSYCFLMPGIQASSITSSFSHAFGLEPWQTTVPLVILYGIIIFGGIKRISHVAEWVIPFMAIGYLLIALVVIVFNIHKLPGVLQQIVMGAFGLDATFAGILGSTISWGIKRGVYSNEAGQGSGPHAAGAAEVDHPAEQGLVQALSVYIDTLLVCSATGFMILLTGTYNVVSEDGDYIVNNIGAVDAGPIFSQMAVDRVFAGFGSPFVAISLFFFAFTTMLSYYYNAETNLAYLFHRKKHYCWTIALRVSIISIIVLATFHPSQLAWALGDLGIGLCAWFNLIAIILLGKVAFRILDDYEQRLSGSDPMSFDPVPFGVSDDSQVWTAQKSERKL